MLSDAEAFPPALGTIVRRCLEKRPDDRFQSAADLAFALRAIVSSTTSGARPSLPVPRVRRWLWPVVVGLTGILLIAAGFLLRDRISSREPSRYQRLTFRSGLVTNARFTSDWRNVIYSAKLGRRTGRVYLAVPGIPDSRDLGLPDGSIITGVSSNNEIGFIMCPFRVLSTCREPSTQSHLGLTRREISREPTITTAVCRTVFC